MQPGAKHSLPQPQPRSNSLSALHTGKDSAAAFEAPGNPHEDINKIMNLPIT